MVEHSSPLQQSECEYIIIRRFNIQLCELQLFGGPFLCCDNIWEGWDDWTQPKQFNIMRRMSSIKWEGGAHSHGREGIEFRINVVRVYAILSFLLLGCGIGFNSNSTHPIPTWACAMPEESPHLNKIIMISSHGLCKGRKNWIRNVPFNSFSSSDSIQRVSYMAWPRNTSLVHHPNPLNLNLFTEAGHRPKGGERTEGREWRRERERKRKTVMEI